MLTAQEYTDVTEVLADILSRDNDARAFIATTFVGADKEMLRALPNTFAVATQQASFIVSWCLDSQWTNNPSMLEQLVVVLTTNYGSPFTTQLDRIRRGIDPNPEPTNTLWLAANMPFFSRKTLRSLLKNLLATDAQPILRIVDPPQDGGKCGKTYTRELLEYIRGGRPYLRLAFVHIDEGLAPSFSAEAVAEALVAPTGRDLATVPRRSTSSYARALCRWVLNAAMGTAEKWVYVLDGFDQNDLPQETRDLLQALAMEIAGGEYRRRMRLLLIDYPKPLPGVQPAKILREELPPASTVGVNDLADCLAAHYADLASRGSGKRPDALAIQAVAASLVQNAPGPAERLEYFNTTLTQLRNDDLQQLGCP